LPHTVAIDQRCPRHVVSTCQQVVVTNSSYVDI